MSALTGKRVLITRPRADADELSERLVAAGAQPLEAPTIEIGPPDRPARAEQVLDELESFKWIVFTSVHGVDAFFDRLGAGAPRALAEISVAAAGPKTAQRLTSRGARADVVPTRYVGEEVARALIERTAAGDRILLYRAQGARADLPATLRAAGRRVDDVAAYKTMTVRDPAIAERASLADVWTFASASAVRGFLENVADAPALARQRTVACLGPITAAAARAAGLPVHVVAERYTVEGLIASLEGAAQSPA